MTTWRRVRHSAAFLALAVLLAPASHAGGLLAELEARSFRLEGAGIGEGALGYLGWPDEASPLAAELEASGRQAVLQVDEHAMPVVAAGVSPQPGENDVRETTHGEFRLAVTHAGADARIYVAGEGATFAYEGRGPVKAQPWGDGELRMAPRASTERPALSIDTAHASRIAFMGGDAVVVRGSFTLVLWDVNFTLEDAQGVREVRTGEDHEPAAKPAPTGLPAERAVKHEAYLRVVEGQIRLPAADNVQVLAPDGALRVREGGARFEGAVGRLAGASEGLSGQAVEIHGSFDVRFGGVAGDAIPIEVTGVPSRVELNGQFVASRSPLPALPWLGAAVAVAAAGGALALQAVLRRRRLRRMEAAVGAGSHAELGRIAATFRAWGPYREDARLLHAVGLVRAGRLAEARGILESSAWKPRSVGTREFLLARIHAVGGNTATAVRHLLECLLVEPSYRLDALADPVLGPLVGRALAAGTTGMGAAEGYV